MQKQVPMTISYFMPLVTKIFIFLGDDEVIPSIDPAKVCQRNHKIKFSAELLVDKTSLTIKDHVL